MVMRLKVKGWMTGKEERNAKTGSGYYIKLRNKKDRDKYFKKNWKDVEIELLNGDIATPRLTPSFWKTDKPCLELRDNRIGKWMTYSHLAPWNKGEPPTFELNDLDQWRELGAFLTDDPI